MISKWVTVTEACQALSVSDSTIRRYVKQGKLKGKTEEGRLLILLESDQHLISRMPSTDEIRRLESEVEYLRQQLGEKDAQIVKLQGRLEQKDEYLQTELKRKDEQMAEASNRHDTIVLQLTRQLENQQKLLEYHQSPWWQRWFRRSRTMEGK